MMIILEIIREKRSILWAKSILHYNGEKNCLICGSELKSAIYYRAKPENVDVKKTVNYVEMKRTTSTTITYANISKHIGGICAACGQKKYKKTRTRGLKMIAVGLGVLILFTIISIACFNMINNLSGNLGTFIEVLMPLSIITGILLFIVGMVLSIYGSKYSWFKKNPKYMSVEDALSFLFVKNADTTKIPIGFQILSKGMYDKLKHK